MLIKLQASSWFSASSSCAEVEVHSSYKSKRYLYNAVVYKMGLRLKV